MCMDKIDLIVCTTKKAKTVYTIKIITEIAEHYLHKENIILKEYIESLFFKHLYWKINERYKTKLNPHLNLGYYSFHSKKIAIKYLLYFSEISNDLTFALYKAEIPINSKYYKGMQRYNITNKTARAYLSNDIILKKELYRTKKGRIYESN